MINSVRYERSPQMQMRHQDQEEPTTPTTTPPSSTVPTPPKVVESPQGSGNILCTHDGVLLKKAGAEHISNINTSGALSLVEYSSPRRLYIEWRPNISIVIADDTQDQGDWALVDTISRRTRTTSECKAFNTSPPTANSATGRVIRTPLEELISIEVRNRGQTLRFMRKSDGHLHSDFFFQHGNAELFVRSMRQLHIIDVQPAVHAGEEYVILTAETQKLKKTFAELDIGEIKATSNSNDSWLPDGVVDFLLKFPDYVQPHRSAPRVRPGAPVEQKSSPLSTDNYQLVALSNSGSSGSQSRGSSLEKSSPNDSELENVKEEDEKIVNTLPERQVIERGAPLNETQWLEFQTPDGRTSDPTRIRELVFRGGIVHSLRAEVWRYLLNYYQWSDTAVERIERRKQKSIEYYSMKAQWLSMSTTQEKCFSAYRERKCQIDKDVKRTDRSLEFFAGENNPNLTLLQGILMTYAMYNFDLGYVQGMSDLLAPILAIQENEVDAFWCFVGFMDLVLNNFDIDQAGMKAQFLQMSQLLEFANPRLYNYMLTHESENMYFTFRWLLVWYKREFANEDVLTLWESMWTRLPCPNFQLLISVAILDQQTDIIIESKYEFPDILKHVNELSGQLDVKRTLEVAEAIYLQIKKADNLPNKIRKIIGEPLIEEPIAAEEQQAQPEDFDDSFDELVPELSPAERQRQQELLEEACERSMYLQFM